MKRCKDNLKDCYLKRTNQKKSSKWRKLGDPTLYVDVTLVRAKVLPERFCEEHALGLVKSKYHPYVTTNELLKDGDGKVILIEGEPGAGKTTLTFHICKEWANGKLLVNDIVFWTPLCHYKLVTTTDQLLDQLGCPEMIDYVRQNNGKGLVLILDGWDELPNDLQTSSLFRDIIFGTETVFNRSTIIVTSRPTCSDEIAELVEETNSHYQILGFDRQKAISYINEYLHLHSNSTSADFLLAFLDNNEYLQQHFYIPISVVIICFVYHSDGKQIPQTLSRLYERYVVLCLRSNIPNICLQDLGKFEAISSIPEKMKLLFQKLCKMAFDMLKDNKLVLNEEEFDFSQDDLNNLQLQLKQFDGFGLLHVDHYTDAVATVRTSYSFIHRAVQELLAAIYIRPTDTDNISHVLENNFYKGSYMQNMFPFLFGLVPKEHLKTLAEKLIDIYNRSGRDTELFSLVLYCLFEAHDEGLCREFGKVFDENKDINLHLHKLLSFHYACYFIAGSGIKRLNLSMNCSLFGIKGDHYCKILNKYLQNTSTDFACFGFAIHHNCGITCKGMELFAKTLSTHKNILSVKLMACCDPGCIAILCGSLCKHNSQITNLKLLDTKLNKSDFGSIGSLTTTCFSLESLYVNCSPSEGVCLDSSISFCEALYKTKSLQKLTLPQWNLCQAGSEVFGNMITRNCSLKELCINVATADCLDLILNGLSSNTSITNFRAWPTETSASNTLGQCVKKCLALNNSLNILILIGGAVWSSYVQWSSTQVVSVCAGLCSNTTVVTLDISGCYIDAEACNAICGMLSQNSTVQHLFLNPVHLEKQEAIAIIDSCKTNATLEDLSLVQWPSKRWLYNQGKWPFQFCSDEEINHIVQKIQELRHENAKAMLNVYWLVAII